MPQKNIILLWILAYTKSEPFSHIVDVFEQQNKKLFSFFVLASVYFSHWHD